MTELPNGWRRGNIRRFASMKTGHTPSRLVPEYWLNATIPWFTLGDVWQLRDGKRVYVDSTAEKISELGLRQSAAELLPAGTVLLSRTASVGFSGIMRLPMATSQDFWNWVCGPELLPSYLNYQFKAIAPELRSLNMGSTHQTIYQKDAAGVELVVPPPSQQRAIVEFLDSETAKIDALIAKQEQLIATLREDRAATITHAVTKGLDPHVDLVQPHDTALPTCPKHWTHQIRLKRVAEVQTGLTLGKSVDPDEAVDVPYLRVANVQTSGVDLEEVKTVAVHRSEVARYLLRSGDVLMTEGGDIDKLGRGCVWSGEISPCIHQNHVFAVRCKDTLSTAFLVYLLDTAVARNYFFTTAKKTTNLASTNSTTLGAFTFSLPPRPEQDEIVGHLNERCAGLDALIVKANAVIAVLREYRSALITDAVTGKIDVRGAVAQP